MQSDGEHIWLRQSVTLTVQGQTRTIEMAVPVRPGATADEVEALLSEADAGMQRLSRHLDAQVAMLTGAAPLAPAHPAPAIAPAPTPATPATPHTPAHAATPQRDQSPAASATPPARAASGSLAKPATPAPAVPPETPATSSVPLSVKDFIAAAQTELNLTPKQAMEQLGVKSLSGLNLREALEMLRRQSLRSGNPGNPGSSSGSSAPAAASMPSATTSSSSRAADATPSTAPARYFEEEDDGFDVTFSVDGEDDLDDEFAAAGESGEASAMRDDGFNGDEDEFDLDDVPDFGAPPASPPAAPASRPTARRTAPAAPPVEELEEIAMPPAQPVNGDTRARALQIIGHMRGIAGGGTTTTQQRAAYRNIVVSELGEPEAKALVQGLWRVSTERLGAEQLDTLLSWGKRDTFREDAALVLAALRAERERAAAKAATTATDVPATPAGRSAARPAAPRSTTTRSRTSARPAGGE